MPWTCPACSAQIRHNANEASPRVDVVYRCAVCRLELVYDTETGKMKIAPMPDSPRSSRGSAATQKSHPVK